MSFAPSQKRLEKHLRLAAGSSGQRFAACCASLALALTLCLVLVEAYGESALQLAKGSQLHRRLGEHLADSDLARIDESLASGKSPVTDRWRNPFDGTVYVLSTAESFDTAAGPCRAFDLTATIETRRTAVHGLACRKHGQWRIVE